MQTAQAEGVARYFGTARRSRPCRSTANIKAVLSANLSPSAAGRQSASSKELHQDFHVLHFLTLRTLGAASSSPAVTPRPTTPNPVAATATLSQETKPVRNPPSSVAESKLFTALTPTSTQPQVPNIPNPISHNLFGKPAFDSANSAPKMTRLFATPSQPAQTTSLFPSASSQPAQASSLFTTSQPAQASSLFITSQPAKGTSLFATQAYSGFGTSSQPTMGASLFGRPHSPGQ